MAPSLGTSAARDYVGAQGIPGDGLLGGDASGADRHCDRRDFGVLHRVWSDTFVQVMEAVQVVDHTGSH